MIHDIIDKKEEEEREETRSVGGFGKGADWRVTAMYGATNRHPTRYSQYRMEISKSVRLLAYNQIVESCTHASKTTNRQGATIHMLHHRYITDRQSIQKI